MTQSNNNSGFDREKWLQAFWNYPENKTQEITELEQSEVWVQPSPGTLFIFVMAIGTALLQLLLRCKNRKRFSKNNNCQKLTTSDEKSEICKNSSDST